MASSDDINSYCSFFETLERHVDNSDSSLSADSIVPIPVGDCAVERRTATWWKSLSKFSVLSELIYLQVINAKKQKSSQHSRVFCCLFQLKIFLLFVLFVKAFWTFKLVIAPETSLWCATLNFSLKIQYFNFHMQIRALSINEWTKRVFVYDLDCAKLITKLMMWMRERKNLNNFSLRTIRTLV